jgi:hypothetical protein
MTKHRKIVVDCMSQDEMLGGKGWLAPPSKEVIAQAREEIRRRNRNAWLIKQGRKPEPDKSK